MDAEARRQWRERLKKTYPWLCPICKTAYTSQPQFEQMVGVVELIRHSECGHVIMCRAGGAEWLDRYIDPSREGAPEMPLRGEPPPVLLPVPWPAKQTRRQPRRQNDAS